MKERTKSNADEIVEPARPHEKYRSFGGYKSLAEADAELRAYWMEALESLRIANYGEATNNARIARVFGVSESRGR